VENHSQSSIEHEETKNPHRKLSEEQQNSDLNNSSDNMFENFNEIDNQIKNGGKFLKRLNSFQKDKDDIEDYNLIRTDKAEIYDAEKESEKRMINSDLSLDVNLSKRADFDINHDQANNKRYRKKVIFKIFLNMQDAKRLQVLIDSINWCFDCFIILKI